MPYLRSIVVNLVLAFYMGTDMEAIATDPIGQPLAAVNSTPLTNGFLSDGPIMQIFFNSFGKNGTLALWSFLILVQFMMGSSSVNVFRSFIILPLNHLRKQLLASSRQTFAFARDGALPLSSIIYRINPYTKTPVNGVWIGASLALLLGCLTFAGPAATTAIFALAVAGQNLYQGRRERPVG